MIIKYQSMLAKNAKQAS